MTTDSKPRIKITYATLRNDNEDLHAQFEEGVAAARAGPRRVPPELRRRRAGATATGRSRCARRSTATSCSGRSPAERSRTSTTPSQPPVPPSRRGPPAVARARRDHQPAAELISERLMEYCAAHGDRGRQEPARGARRRRGMRRPASATTPRPWSDNDGFDHPMGNLGDAAVHTRSILRPHGVLAVISPFNFPMALAGGPAGAALLAGNTVVLKPSSTSPLSAVKLIEAYIDAGVPAGVFNLVMGPGETVGQALQDHPGIDGIVFTGSYEVGMRAVPRASPGVAAAVHRRDGRQEPGDRVAPRRPRRGGRGDHALGLRVRRAEVLGELAGLRRAAGPRRARPAARREDREDHDRRPARPRELARVRSSTSGPSTGIRRPSPRRAATGPCSPAASG